MTGPASSPLDASSLPGAGKRGEIARWLVLLAAGGWLLHPFATSRQLGAGDALWYANMLADFVTQWRHGIFPVFAGQTEHAFNGAVYPLRVAPLYQHLAGLLDLCTSRQLGWFALQHLCVIVSGLLGLYGCYFSLCAITNDRLTSSAAGTANSGLPSIAAPAEAPTSSSSRWFATGLAILYLSCPGVLGTIYTQDLYMTWMTVPFLPLAIYGSVRAFHKNDLVAQLWLAGSLALLWLAHSPIALWATFLMAGMQSVRLLFIHRDPASWRRAGLGAILFILLAQYPFVSVAALHTPGTVSTVTSGLAHQEVITSHLREVFPGLLLPLSAAARQLSDLQLGYGFWLVLFLSTAFLFRPGNWELRLLLAACAVLLLLLLPLPGLNDWLWAHLPEQIKRITYYWPMQRFYLLLAAMLAAIGQLGFLTRPCLRTRFAAALLFAACGWSLWESRQFIRAGQERTASRESSERSQRPENFLLMNHAFGLFAALPAYFSHGAMDPRLETRLLDAAHFQVLALSRGPAILEGALRGEIDANPGILKLSPAFPLIAGRQYELELTFLSQRPYEGVLQLTGRDFFREYSLPSSGEPLAFGSAPGNSGRLPLFTTAPAGDEITLRFIPTAMGAKPVDFTNFARFTLREIDSASAPVVVSSLLPFRASTRATPAGWLETPRMFQPGYRARVDGQPVEVRASAQSLVMIPVGAGEHRVELDFPGPWILRLSYWFALLAWLGLLLFAGLGYFRRSRLPATPAAA